MHGPHMAPFVPHNVLFWLAYGRQLLPSQHPAEHDEALQIQEPFDVLHVVPPAHGAQMPLAPH